MSNDTLHKDDCELCERLQKHLSKTKNEYQAYWCKPVPSFGAVAPGLLIVGLAPGKHGANATGRPFTGDYAGELLYKTLYKFGFSTHPTSVSVDDELLLRDCRIVNAVKCLPPENKPKTEEVINCNSFLASEIMQIKTNGVIIALGTVAHNAVLRAIKSKLSRYKFSHGGVHFLDDISLTLIDSYHCSRYNTQTKRLTTGMFEEIFRNAKEILQS